MISNLDKTEILERINFLKEYLDKIIKLGENLDKEDTYNEIKEYLGYNSSTIQSYLIDAGLEKKRNLWDSTPDLSAIPSYFLIVKDRTTFELYFTKPISVLRQYIKIYEKFYENYDETKTEIKGVISELEEALVKNIFEVVLKGLIRDHDSSRSKIPPQRRETVIKRDKQICQLCGDIVVNKEDIEIDHIYPYSLGGLNEEYNLMVTHSECNKNKGKKIHYYNSEEGRMKLLLNIKLFVRELQIIQDFTRWLKYSGDKRRKT